MTKNEIIQKLASKQAQLIQKVADCTVLRNEIAELKKASKPVPKAKPATKKPARKSVKKRL